jgi:hypothetical protein
VVERAFAAALAPMRLDVVHIEREHVAEAAAIVEAQQEAAGQEVRMAEAAAAAAAVASAHLPRQAAAKARMERLATEQAAQERVAAEQASARIAAEQDQERIAVEAESARIAEEKQEDEARVVEQERTAMEQVVAPQQLLAPTVLNATATPFRPQSEISQMAAVRTSPVFSEETSPSTEEEEEEDADVELKHFEAKVSSVAQLEVQATASCSHGVVTIGKRPLNDESARLVLRAGRALGLGPTESVTIWHDRSGTAQRVVSGSEGGVCYEALHEPVYPEQGRGRLYLLGEWPHSGMCVSSLQNACVPFCLGVLRLTAGWVSSRV